MAWEAAWETVHFDAIGATRLERMKVPSGWLYRTIVWNSSERAVALCFVPDAPEPEYYR